MSSNSKQSMQKTFGIVTAAIIVFFVVMRLWFASNFMPEVEYKLIDGTSLSSTELRGKVVVFSFWSTSCGPCIAEMPHLVKMYEQYHEQGFEIVGVALAQDKIRDVVQLVHKKELPYKVAYDAAGQAAQAWGGVAFTPTVFIVDRKGNVVKKIVGSEHVKVEQVVISLL